MYSPQVNLILKAMKLAYRICEAEHVHFSKWRKDDDIEMEMAVYLDSLLERESENFLRENQI